ncbi:MAG: DUF308 domain-containing protein [Ruminococcus sp.]|nr:DUF308 domain-containing protein [Ruminococcus sp.]
MKKEVKEKTFLERISLDFSKIILSNIVLYILFLIVGLSIYLKPLIALNTVGIIIGIAFIILGLFDIYEYLMRVVTPIFTYRIFLGVLTIILGLFIILNPFKLIKVLTIGLGIYLIINALVKGLEAFKLKSYEYDGWLLMFIIAILLLIFGIFITINPMASMDIAEATGIFIILGSILEICNLFMLYSKAKDITKLLKNSAKK